MIGPAGAKTDGRTDRQTGMTANSRFSEFCEGPRNQMPRCDHDDSKLWLTSRDINSCVPQLQPGS